MRSTIFPTFVALTLAAGGLAEESRGLASGVWGAWKSKRVKSMYFSEIMEDGAEVELLTHGPFTVSASCGTIEGEPMVRLQMTVTAVEEDGDEWVYGFPDYLPLDYYGSCVGTTAAGTTSDCIVWSTGSGESHIAGAYTSLSGYYVAFGGPSTIGFSKSYLARPEYRVYANGFTAEEVAAFPAECAVSGELTYNRAAGDDP